MTATVHGPHACGPYDQPKGEDHPIPGRMRGRPAGRPGALPCPGPSGSASRTPGRVHAAPTAQRKRDVRPFPAGCRGGLQAARERCPARGLPGRPPAPRAAYTRPLRPDGKGMSGRSRQDVGAACRPPGSAALPGAFRVGRNRPRAACMRSLRPAESTEIPLIPNRIFNLLSLTLS